MKIIDIIKESKEIEFYCLVKNLSEGTAANGSKFLSLTLEDQTGQIQAKKWDANEETIERGEVYLIKGAVQEYKDKFQVILKEYRLADENQVDVNSFFKSAPMDKAEIQEEIKKYLYMIENEAINSITKTILNKYVSDYLTYPAATQNHHSYLSGLGYHTVTMLRMADKFIELYPYLDKDYLYAGIILHDFAKVIELSEDKSPEYTIEGKLIGHLVLGNNIIKEVSTELGYQDNEETLLLQHMVISHHGRKEWGSPQRPMTAEAEAVHYIDNIDSKFESIREAFESTKPKEWTKRIPVLEGRSIYRHK